ncbi:MAG: hypothetical protein WB765_05960 [Acidimicrobiales bacterium]
MLPPVSVPIPARIRPEAIPFPVPALDPPGERSRFHGFLGMAKGLDESGDPMANSDVVSLPVMTAPAALRRATTGPSFPAPHARSRIRLFPVVGPSAMARMSFTPMGMPWYGPLSMPLAKSSSACSAWAMA